MTHVQTPFRLECDMLGPLVECLPTVFQLDSGQRQKVLCEPTIGSVIPDVLVGIWSGELPRCSTLNFVARHILSWLATQKVASGEQQLREELLLSHYASTAAMTSLKRVGAVAQNDSGEVVLQPEFDISDNVKLIAIEMKLRRWREALAQAVVYREFADESYVVLDGNQVRLTADIRAAFASAGVGLLLQCGGSIKRIISAPRMQKPAPSADRLFAVGKLAKSGPYCLA